MKYLLWLAVYAIVLAVELSLFRATSPEKRKARALNNSNGGTLRLW